MKNIILPFVFCCAIACNNESKSTGNDDSLSVKSSMRSEDASAATTGGTCSNLLLFKKGTEIQATSYDKNGKETSNQTSTVMNVASTADGMTSEVEMKSKALGKDEKVITGKYMCDGRNLYADLSSLFASMDAKGAKIEGDPISFPVNVTEGETLPDANYTMTMTMGGKEMKTTVHMKERKVGAREKIATPAGTFDCYRISANSEAEVSIEGMDEKMKQIMESAKSSMPKQSFVMYYDPAVTIVKVEMYSGDKLVSYSEVVSIK